MKYMLKYPDMMLVEDENGETHNGGSQEWYEDAWQKKAGCGPVAACNLLWYLMRLRGDSQWNNYTNLMRELFEHVTPGLQGVNTSAMFSDGITRYGEKIGINVIPNALDIPAKPRSRPSLDTVIEFIQNAIQKDAPLAFLVLSNGKVKSLESWHWVTITAIDSVTSHIDVCDYGKTFSADISEWLETSILGGALVHLRLSNLS